jgi:alpha-tubulin suppressor-like RCC1 family protein
MSYVRQRGLSIGLSRRLLGAIAIACVLPGCGSAVDPLHAEDVATQSESLKAPLHLFKSVSVGYAHACALSRTGVPYCWGDKSSLQTGEPLAQITALPDPVPVAASQHFVSVVAEGSSGLFLTSHDGHACGLTASGQAFCWGGNDRGQLGVGPMGAGGSVPAAPVPGLTFSQLVVGDQFSCGLEAGSGWASCWGSNDSGKLGNNNASVLSSAAPQLVVGQNGVAPTFTQISAGGSKACGLDSQQQAWCWGLLSSGGTGPISRFADRAALPAQQQGRAWSSISTAGDTTCAIAAGDSSAGQAFCWGLGQLGNHAFPADGAVAGGLTYRSLSVGTGHSCGLTTAGDIMCWGNNNRGQLGNGATPAPALVEQDPVLVTGGSKWQSLAVGANVTCATNLDNALFCWGDGAQFQFGDHRTSPGLSSVPVQAAGFRGYASVALANNFSCGLARSASSDGALLCWGIQGAFSKGPSWHSERVLGVEPLQACSFVIAGVGMQQPCRKTPWPTAFGRTFVAISAGRAHTCALDSTGQAFCFGDNSTAQLGNNTFPGFEGGTTQTADPQAVLQFETFSQIAAGDYHTCAIDGSTQSAFCWGSNASGQIGGNLIPGGIQAFRVSVTGGHNFVKITAGGSHSCAIDVNGDLYCWGANSGGQVGTGATSTIEATPVKVALPGLATSVSAGFRHTCASVLQAASQVEGLYCWGANAWGELGDGTQVMKPWPVPVPVIGGGSYLDYVTGHGFTCGIRLPPSSPGGVLPISGPLYCWGAVPGSNAPVPLPTLVAPGLSFRFVRGGGGNGVLCAVMSDGSTQCFGLNHLGQLGSVDAPLVSSMPIDVTGD